jgi:hypothetical protein
MRHDAAASGSPLVPLGVDLQPLPSTQLLRLLRCLLAHVLGIITFLADLRP